MAEVSPSDKHHASSARLLVPVWAAAWLFERVR